MREEKDKNWIISPLVLLLIVILINNIIIAIDIFKR